MGEDVVDVKYTSMRLSVEACNMITELATYWHVSKTAVMEIAIRKLAETSLPKED